MEKICNNLYSNLYIKFPKSFKSTLNENNDNSIIIYDNNILCVDFGILFDGTYYNIFINELNKCSMSATDILENLEFLCFLYAKEIRYIFFSDASNIQLFNNPNYLIEFSTLRILSRGESWYNSLGFYSKDHCYDKNIWFNLRLKKNIISLLNSLSHESYFDDKSTSEFGKNRVFISCINNISKNFLGKNFINSKEEFYNLIKLVIDFIININSNINNLTLGEIYKTIETAKNIGPNKEFMCYILVGLITPLIKYDHYLYKTINYYIKQNHM